MADQNKNNINYGALGLNLDSIPNQIAPGTLTYALNASVENFDGNSITYQNDIGNIGCISFPAGFKVIGVKNITSLTKIIYWLVNPTTGVSQIGYSDSNECVYNVLIDDTISSCKLSFSINNPIQQIIVKTTNCSVQLYWTDGLNARRFLDLENLPWVERKDPNNEYKTIKVEGYLDCNKLNVQPFFNIPELTPTEVVVGGALKSGTYQFAIQYSSSLGEAYTSYFGVTNPLGVFADTITPNFDAPTTKAVRVTVDNLDISGLYDYFNLAVIETVNLISTVKLVGTYRITNKTQEVIYTGTEVSVPLAISDIFEKFPTYDTADGVFEVDNILGWYNLKSDDDINYQQIWSNVKLQWETHRISYNNEEGYNEPLNTALYKGYMRDEVYAFEGCFILKNGKQTRSFHIPGRAATPFDRELIAIDNKDNSVVDTQCEEPITKQRWQVYNTGSVVGQSPDYSDDSCYQGPYQYGEMAYWESEERYPKNPIIWGNLAGQKIKHHKFPDSVVTHIYDSTSVKLVEKTLFGITYHVFALDTTDQYIFPIGVKLLMNTLYDAINNSNLTQQQKSEISGFKILRGNRTTNKSVIAKGLLTNVGKSTYEDKTFYFANYPYNDLRKDPYFVTEKLVNHAGYVPSKSLNAFSTDASKERFTFHSPDTHFYQPTLSNEGSYLKMETIEYGSSEGHFVKVLDNAEYKFLTSDTVKAANALALASGFNIKEGDAEFNMANVSSTYVNALEIFDKLTPFTNFGYTYNSVGNYIQSYPIPNSGNKIRSIEYNTYLLDEEKVVDNSETVRNIRRESSVYIHTSEPFLFPTDYSSAIPEDTSRYNLASGAEGGPGSELFVFVTRMPSSSIATGAVYRIGNDQYSVISTNFVPTPPLSPSGVVLYDGYIFLQPIAGAPTTLSSAGGLILVTPSGQPSFIGYSRTGFSNPNSASDPSPETIRTTNINGYYGSIKRDVPFQWGKLYTYETIDTGYYHKLYRELLDLPAGAGYIQGAELFQSVPTIFGGDIFINKFSYKTKQALFRQNTVKQLNQSDIDYTELGLLNYPMFWISTKPVEGALSAFIKAEVQGLVNQMDQNDMEDRVLRKIAAKAAKKVFAGLLKNIYESIGVKNVNLDRAQVDGLAEIGMMYMFVYGIPTFFVESEVNVDYRQAFNDKEGNFYPNVGEIVPDDWLQEVNVPIAFDNTYFYNQTFSKQNKENLFTHLREDWDPDKVCLTEFPNRAIWSDKSSLEETKNNWLTYRPSTYYDLPKSYGTVTSIDNLLNNQLLVRFENKSQIYNALTTVQVSEGPAAYLGNSRLFTGTPPLDLSNTDLGYAGSQHKFLLKTEHGNIFVDSKRGNIFLLSNNGTEDLAAKGLSKWFAENLPFKLSRDFGTIDDDNAFNGVGITGVYDSLYQRLFITKIDYELKAPYVPISQFNPTTVLIGTTGEPFIVDGEPFPTVTVNIGAADYFDNRSWTLSYCFKTNAWISFHSFAPNYYIGNTNYFQTGINTDTIASLWSHNKSFTKYTNYYGLQHSYVVEYPFVYKTQDEILQSIKDFTTSRIYTDFDSYYEPDETIFFNKAILYTNQQNSGILELVPKAKNNLSLYGTYPRYNTESKEILVTKSDNFFNYNQFWDISVSKSVANFIKTGNLLSEDKELNQANMDYQNRSYRKAQLRAKDLKVRHILDNRSDVKLISKFVLTEQTPSYK